MVITDVKITLMENGRLLAYCAIVVDDVLVIKDIRIIQGEQGLIVAMPDKQRATRCEHCEFRIRQRDKYCPRCGEKLAFIQNEFNDICHPINNDCRTDIDKTILEKYQCALTDSQIPATQLNSSVTE